MKTKLYVVMAMVMMLFSMGVSAKKVHTLGDSTMAPYDESATNTRGWGMYFGNFLTNGWTSVNYAKGGRDSRGGYNELWQNAKNNVEAGDYVLIQFAHNDTQYGGMDNLQLQEYYTSIGDTEKAAAVKKDGRGTIPASTYKECLKQIIDAVKAKGATPILVSLTPRNEWENGKIERRNDSYGAWYRQVVKETGVEFVDLHNLTADFYDKKCGSKAKADKYFKRDHTHTSLLGAKTNAQCVAQGLKANKSSLADYLKKK